MLRAKATIYPSQSTSHQLRSLDRAQLRRSIVDMSVLNIPVLPKWLSYGEQSLAGPLLPKEVRHFTRMARWMGTILQLASRQFERFVLKCQGSLHITR